MREVWYADVSGEYRKVEVTDVEFDKCAALYKLLVNLGIHEGADVNAVKNIAIYNHRNNIVPKKHRFMG
jgi:hypothetical protein